FSLGANTQMVDILPANKKNSILTPGSFDRLLAWLDPDRERAGKRYEEIRTKLIKIFVCRGCAYPEELADETIDRVIRKIPEVADSYIGDPALYFYNVARLVHLESLRKKTIVPPPTVVNEDIELEYQCLQNCIEHLSSENRELIIQYYQEEKQAKIDNRKKLAEKLGIALNALRIRATRIRTSLEQCITDCLREKGLK
ncbi:MAG: hypothetical protein AB1489_39580, partial [Acidobacteriota bacterium]